MPSAQILKLNQIKSFVFCRIQASGLGALEPNTVLLAWPENWRERDQWRSFVRTYHINSIFLIAFKGMPDIYVPYLFP